MNDPVLYMVLAKNCHACQTFKSTYLESVKALFTSQGLKYHIVEVSDMKSLVDNKEIPDTLRPFIEWYPFMAVLSPASDGQRLLNVFNGVKEGSIWRFRGNKYPTAANLAEFYREETARYRAGPVTAELRLVPPPATPTTARSTTVTSAMPMNKPVGMIPTSACRIGGFKSRII